MNVYLSHTTALRFWRAWSAALPIPLRTFHDMRGVDPALLPCHGLPSSSTLRHCATREADLRSILDAARQGEYTPSPSAAVAHEVRTALASALAPTAFGPTDSIPTDPIHVLTRGTEGSKNSSQVVRHRVSTAHPRQSFIEVAPHLFVCSPELVFFQLAPLLPLGGRLALGYELCGCYPLSAPSSDALVRRPLSTPQRLHATATRISAKGATAARAAARQILAKAGSIMETELAILAFTATRDGGFGLAPARLNEPVALSARARSNTGLSRVVCDFYWPEAKVALEYDGRAAHRSPHQQDHDSRKRHGLQVDGVDVTTVTSSQFHHIGECERLLTRCARRIGKPKRKRRPEHLAKHMSLRHDVRVYHRKHFPGTFQP